MARRSMLVAVLIAVTAAVVTPGGAHAQDNDNPLAGYQFPTGAWNGELLVGGTIVSVSTGDNSGTDTRTVIGNATSVELDVGPNGVIRSGTMSVDMTWISVASGVNSAGDAFNVNSDFEQDGTLQISGTMRRLVVSGSVTWDVQTFASGDLVEEVSGERPLAVEWVFEVDGARCGVILSSVVQANAPLITSVLAPIDNEGENQRPRNDLYAVIAVWPQGAGFDEQEVGESIRQLQDVVNSAMSDAELDVRGILQIVQAVETMRDRLARLDECDAPGLDLALADAWFEGALVDLIGRLLENPERFGTRFLSELITLAARAGVLGAAGGSGLFDAFRDAFAIELTEEIAEGDLDTILDLSAVAAQYGFDSLYDDAIAALDELAGGDDG